MTMHDLPLAVLATEDIVLRSMYGVGSEPATDAVVRSIASRYAKSSPTSAATTSHSHDLQFEKREASLSNIGPTSAHPIGLKAAPKTVTGSVCDHIWKRGRASPLCSAVSAW